MTKITTITGPDISEFNGNVDFEKVKKDHGFVILRCGYGKNYETQDDAKFQRNADECERLGIPYGVYLYSYAVDTDSVDSEVRHIMRLIKGRTVTRGIWYDLEDRELPTDRKVLTDICLKFIDMVEKEGYLAGFYTNLSWIGSRFEEERLAGKNLWIAQWNDTLDYSGSCKVIMWQYTDSGKIDGINGSFDLNWYFEDTDEELPEEEEDLRDTIYRAQVTADIGLNVRRAPSVTSEVIRAVPMGTVLDIVYEYDGWGQVSGGGWVSLEFTRKLDNFALFEVTPDIGLNVRSGPSTSDSVMEALTKGTRVKITRIEGEWGQRLEGGYLKMEYLRQV